MLAVAAPAGMGMPGGGALGGIGGLGAGVVHVVPIHPLAQRHVHPLAPNTIERPPGGRQLATAGFVV